MWGIHVFIHFFGFAFKTGIINAMELKEKINIYCCYSCEPFGVTSLDTASNLGLLLFTMEHPNLTSSSILIHHKWYVLLVSETLLFYPHLKVRLSNEERTILSDDLILGAAYLWCLFEFMDDVLFPTECNTDRLMQNLIYSGYVCDTTIKNIFAHGPDGSSFFGYWS